MCVCVCACVCVCVCMCVCLLAWVCVYAPHKNVNRLRSSRVSPHSCFAGGVKFPLGEGSAVIYREKNDLLHKAIT